MHLNLLLPEASMKGTGRAIVFSKIRYLKLNKIQLFVITESLHIQSTEKLFCEVSKTCVITEDHF